MAPDRAGSVTRRAERALFLTTPILIAGLAHVAVITLDLVPGLARPIDAGRRWRGRPLLGSNKTWRGFVVMPAATAITIAAQQALAGRSRRLAALAPLARGAPPAQKVSVAEILNGPARIRARSARFHAHMHPFPVAELDLALDIVLADLHGARLWLPGDIGPADVVRFGYVLTAAENPFQHLRLDLECGTSRLLADLS